MDGTLVNSMQYWQHLGRDYLADCGILSPSEELMNSIKPLTQLECAKVFKQEFNIPGTPEHIADEMNARMETHYRNDVTPKNGITDYLKNLKEKGARLCTASATEIRYVDLCLSRLALRDNFDFLLSCEQVGAGKAHPDVYFEAARRLGATPEETAVFEDSLIALKTAKKAGFYTVGIYDETCAEEWDEIKSIADEFITDWQKAER